MSDTPLTDSVNNQFDTWEVQIAELKKQGTEYAKKQLKALAKTIESWFTSETDNLNKNKEKTENSPIYKLLKDIKDLIDDMGSAIEDVIKVIKKIGELIIEALNLITNGILDITMALATTAIRGPLLVTSCL